MSSNNCVVEMKYTYEQYVNYFRNAFKDIVEVWRSMSQDMQEEYENEFFLYGVRVQVPCPQCGKFIQFDNADTEIAHIIEGAHQTSNHVCVCGLRLQIHLTPLTRNQ